MVLYNVDDVQDPAPTTTRAVGSIHSATASPSRSTSPTLAMRR